MDNTTNRSSFCLELVDIAFAQLSQKAIPTSEMPEQQVSKEIDTILVAIWTLVDAMELESVASKVLQQYVNHWQHLWQWAAFLVREDRPDTVNSTYPISLILCQIVSQKPGFWCTMASTPGFMPSMAQLWDSFSISQWRSLHQWGDDHNSPSLPALMKVVVSLFTETDSDLLRQFFVVLGDSPALAASNCLQKVVNALKEPCISYLSVGLRVVIISLKFPDLDAAFESKGSLSVLAYLFYRLTSHRKPVEDMVSISNKSCLGWCLSASLAYVATKLGQDSTFIILALRQRLVRALFKCVSLVDIDLIEGAHLSIIFARILPYLLSPAVTRLVNRCLNSIEYGLYIEEVKTKSELFYTALFLLVETAYERDRVYHFRPRLCEGSQVRLNLSSCASIDDISQCSTPYRVLYRCRGCRGAYYCSRSCQKDSWSMHKYFCFSTPGTPIGLFPFVQNCS